MAEIARVTPLPRAGSVFFDVRDAGRTMRVSWHEDSAAFVLSLWRGDQCTGTFRLAAADAADFIAVLTGPLAMRAAGAPIADAG